LRRDFEKNLEVNDFGEAIHSSCISHYLRYAFGDCDLPHPDTCTNCENFFSFFDKLREILPIECHQSLEIYQQKLLCFMAHHARKIYLNQQLKANLRELDHNGALIIVDYKMRVNPQSARETKADFYGKRGFTLHSVLVYTKSENDGNLNISVFDHWSNDTKQDAWFTASSLHAVIDTLDNKPQWVTIVSDNGPHYHNTELMIILAHWKEWYDISVNKWMFLEAGEAKTMIDSHHAQVSII